MRAILGFLVLAYAAAYSIPGERAGPSSASHLSRRSFGSAVAGALGSYGALFLQLEPAVGKSDQEDVDKQNILKGYVSLWTTSRMNSRHGRSSHN